MNRVQMHGGGDYPPEWGEPVGDRFSAQRTAWVGERVAEMAAVRDAHARGLVRRRLAELEARRWSPERDRAQRDGRLAAVARRAELLRRRASWAA